MIEDWNFLSLEFPQNRWRQMMVDVAYMGDVWLKFFDHSTDSTPRIRRIDCVGGAAGLFQKRALPFESNVRYKILIVSSGLTARVSHGEQRHLVSTGPQKFHQFEQVDFGAAERVVIFVAEQNPHDECSQETGMSA